MLLPFSFFFNPLNGRNALNKLKKNKLLFVLSDCSHVLSIISCSAEKSHRLNCHCLFEHVRALHIFLGENMHIGNISY